MRSILYFLFLSCLIALSFASVRKFLIEKIYGIKQENGVSLPSLETGHAFETENLLVKIHDTKKIFSPKEHFLLKENQHFKIVSISITNKSDKYIEPSWFRTTLFATDQNGNTVHNQPEILVGYYKANSLLKDKILEDKYYSDSLSPHSGLKPILFFFPMDKNAKIIGYTFDDPILKRPKTFKL